MFSQSGGSLGFAPVASETPLPCSAPLRPAASCGVSSCSCPPHMVRVERFGGSRASRGDRWMTSRSETVQSIKVKQAMTPSSVVDWTHPCRTDRHHHNVHIAW